MTVDLRSRARTVVRHEVAEAAFAVLADRGYDAVTVDQLAREIGISRATFFRYFDSKEDVVIETAAPPEHDFAEAVARLQAADGAVRAPAVLLMLGEMLPSAEQQTATLRARVRMTSAVPDLGARLALRRGARQVQLTDVLTAATGDRGFAQVCAAVGFACLDVAWREWARDDGGPDLQRRYATAVEAARAIFAGRP